MTCSEMYDETDAERYADDNASVSIPEALDPLLDRLVRPGSSSPGARIRLGRMTVPLARRGADVASGRRVTGWAGSDASGRQKST